MSQPWTAERIRALRKARELTQSELAKQLKVNRGTVIAWEKGGDISTLSEAALDRLEAEGPRSPEAERAELARYDAVVATVIATGENRARLGVVQGYAEFVLNQLEDLVRRQRDVVNGIRPFAEAEGQALAANVPPEQIPELLASIRRYQSQRGADDEPADRRQGTG